MSIRRSAVLVALLALVVIRPAAAFDGRGCNSRSTDATPKKTCGFVLRGTPVTIYAESRAANADVHVWVTLSGYPEIPPVFECRASGEGFASCSASYPDDTTQINLAPHPLVAAQDPRLICNFEGKGIWGYSCVAGDEPAP